LSLPELWDRAVDHGAEIIGIVLDLWEHRKVPKGFDGLAPLIGDSDLRNTFSDIHLCTLTESDPLPLRSVLQTLSSGSIPDDWQSLV
jgi:hypothetical protein